MAVQESCRHDRNFSMELRMKLNNAPHFSKDAISTTRPRDIDRRTEAMLRSVMSEFRSIHVNEERLEKAQAIFVSGLLGPVSACSVLFNKGLTAQERNGLILHFIGLIVTGNLDNGVHVEPSSDESQAKADLEANKWVQDIRDELLAGNRGKTVFTLGVQRALSPQPSRT